MKKELAEIIRCAGERFPKKHQRCDVCDELTGKCEDDQTKVNGVIYCENCFELKTNTITKISNIKGKHYDSMEFKIGE